MADDPAVPVSTIAPPPAVTPSLPATAAPVVDQEKHLQNTKIVEEFQYLLEKSQQLFAGLRDLPPTGRNWQPYFQRTFEVYTKLWKFQQQNRALLENKDYYGLKRSEIGEAASKIGRLSFLLTPPLLLELYYHYYLRTSETNYLFESYIFYDAIRERQYFKEIVETRNLALVVKKLRYYARFIVVCLLLNRTEMIKKLMDELSVLVEEYTREFKPTDAAEWNVVLSEISTFLEAEKKLTPIDLKGNLLNVSSRVQIERTTKFDKDGVPKMKLQETILVGNFQNQIKFSELTLDMYRILQSLEREPIASAAVSTEPKQPEEAKEAVEGAADADAAGSTDVFAGSTTNKASENGDKIATRRNNPHKYLLYKPTFAQLMLYVATAFKDIGENSALLIYLSADGAKRNTKNEHCESGYMGGIATAVNFSRKPVTDGALSVSGGPLTNPSPAVGGESASTLAHCLHPYDLVPFTRKPLFLIVDSTNSTAFQSMPKVFSAPLVILMGPTEYPASIKDTTQIGSLFTLFLHAPIKAFAFISDTSQASSDTWQACVTAMNNVERCIIEVLDANINSLDKSYRRFLQDDFLRQFICRFILTHMLFSAHSSFKESKHYPSAQPALPANILTSPEIIAKISELAAIAEVAGLYNFAVPSTVGLAGRHSVVGDLGAGANAAGNAAVFENSVVASGL